MISSLDNMILEIGISVLAIPAGFLIAWLARDELEQGRAWFGLLALLSFLGILLFWFFNYLDLVFTALFIEIVACISLFMSYNKRWTRRRFK